MRSFLYFLTALAVIGLAAWAYRENHLTQQAMNEHRALEREVASLGNAITIQRTEWAYLNRPDRLRELVDVNFERLLLVPMTADHFGEIGQVAYPLPVLRSDYSTAVEVFGTLDEDAVSEEREP
ncbi:cell division protein FtsL [Roseinatronobacter alkalisoli]|uniref:Cell division protein FtsL n=1 Tax=Roseinatronobacter alkalisoli TaxID=3028235 RepID=A0ABT5T6G2_9RHOB|nr:cell division protein FtsL [Roseinatronobacter sp. HJB301]MDD7970710.1 cell division protein FtsL [Roseinatronobacter sp. HJB301]